MSEAVDPHSWIVDAGLHRWKPLMISYASSPYLLWFVLLVEVMRNEYRTTMIFLIKVKVPGIAYPCRSLGGHCNECLFYSIADYHNNDHTWLGAFKEDHNSDLNKYIAAIYLATTTATTVGFRDLHPVNKGERLLCIIIMILNIGFDAYFIYSLKYIVSPVRPLPFLGELEMSPPPLLIRFQP